MLNLLRKLREYGDIALAITIIGTILVLLFPIPTGLLDVLLAFSITISITILITTLFISNPLELSVFPTLLLVTTIIRLSLNIASTRLILSRGHLGPSASGHVIEAFGKFVMQGNVVIGIIVFMILTVINFIVITKGSGRIAEVAARFSLDAMPGKQMAIDADLSSGLIKESEARARRRTLEEESIFYGAMDGANKFVRGDAIAGLVITFINLVGGIIVGMLQKGLLFEVAINTYTVLTIGDGLVSQIPSLIISLAAGLLVTKSGTAGSADKAIFGQLTRYPHALWISSLMAGLMALVPGLPFIPFCLLALITGGAGYLIKNSREDSPAQSQASAEAAENDQKPESDEQYVEALRLDSITVELGYAALSLVGLYQGPKLTDQIKILRKQLARQYGFLLPAVRIRDGHNLEPNTYVIKIKELEVARSQVFPEQLLVIKPSGGTIDLPGQETIEPSFGIPAKWIEPEVKDQVDLQTCIIVEPINVVITHLTEVVKDNITELLSYSEVQRLIDDLPEEQKKFVKDIIPDIVNISLVQKVLQNLLSELVSIRDLPTILETMADTAKITKDAQPVTEAVRSRLAKQINYSYTQQDGYIPVISISESWERILLGHLHSHQGETILSLPPSQAQEFMQAFTRVYDEQASKGYAPVLLTNRELRYSLYNLISRFRTRIPVLSYNELHPKFKVRSVGAI